VFVGVAQFLVFLVVAEALYPPYSVSDNFISDLGVGPSGQAGVFNTSIVLLGLFVVLGVYYLHRLFHRWELTIFLLLAGVDAILVGIFTEHFPAIHVAVSFLTFLGVGGARSWRTA